MPFVKYSRHNRSQSAGRHMRSELAFVLALVFPLTPIIPAPGSDPRQLGVAGRMADANLTEATSSLFTELSTPSAPSLDGDASGWAPFSCDNVTNPILVVRCSLVNAAVHTSRLTRRAR